MRAIKCSVLQRSQLYDSGKNLRFLGWSENVVVTERAPRGIYSPPLAELLLCQELLDEWQRLRLCRVELEPTVLSFLHPHMAASEYVPVSHR
jgi:hypothetical protein